MMRNRLGWGRCRLPVAVVIWVALLLLSSCGDGGGALRDPFSYGAGSFSAELEGSFTRLAEDGYGGNPALVGEGGTGVPRPFVATLTVGAPRPDGTRDVTLIFRAPSPLAGMTVRRRGGEITLTLPTDEESLTLPCPASLLRFGEALLPRGDVTAVSPRVEGRYAVTVTAPQDRVATFTFSDEGGLPIAVRVETPWEVLDLSVSPP